jgi:hypothetical protein
MAVLKLVRRQQRGTMAFVYTGRSSSGEQLLITQFLSKIKNVSKVKIHALLYGDDSRTVSYTQTTAAEERGCECKFYLDHCFVSRSFRYIDGAKF